MFDVLNKSNGFEAKVNISRVFRKGPLFFEPSLNISYVDSNHVDYYYGVKTNEGNKFTLPRSIFAQYNNCFIVSHANFSGDFTRIVADYTWYDSAITNSPLVEANTSISARFLFSKFF